MPVKDGLIIVESFGFKNGKITGAAASVDQEAADEFLEVIRKSLKRKSICLNRFLMVTKSPVLEEKCHKGHLLVRKKSNYQDLRQEGIG